MPPRDDPDRPLARRRLLVATGLGGAALLAGCLGEDDGDADTETLSEPSHDAFDVDPEDQPLLYANPDVSGPGGEATYEMQLDVRGQEIESFESFVVHFASGTLHRQGGDDVSVPVDVTVDLLESVEEGEAFLLTWDLAIPTGEYTGLTYDVEAVEIVHEEDGDVTDQFTAPPTSETRSPASVGPGSEYRSMSTVAVDHGAETTFSERTSLGTFIFG